ncbi:MAG: metallophosphoesterase [Candidatus Melainabacteria bacterium]|nr:metallophosphoesterase [Candidatus Melainabacteria bacterium]
MIDPDWLYNVAMFAYCVGSFFFLRKFAHHIWSYLLVGVLYIGYSIIFDIKLCITMWHFLSLAGYAIFLHGTILLAICAYVSWNHFKILRAFFALASVTLIVVSIDAFLIEPHWLSVRYETMTSNKLKKPLRIAVLADIQTDNVGDFEKDMLAKVKAYNPDLILFAGDYLQIYDENRPHQVELLNKLFKEADLQPSLGMFAARGDCDRIPDWNSCFAGLPVQCFEDELTTVKTDDVTVSVLDLDNSRGGNRLPPPVDGFHIILGHAPDYSLKQPKADLLVAGHTHGGQFQIPFFGPIMTITTVPRKWAGGCMTDIGNGSMLCLSRGIGMERQLAPRIRFWCRPEVVFIDVVSTH